MGEDPTSVENVQYVAVAIDELDRVERRISHLLRYAKEEEYIFAPVSIAAVVDSALTQLRAKLDAAHVSVQRNYIVGPTLVADGEKLKQVFANILDNATDALESAAGPAAATADGRADGRRIEVFIDNGTPAAARRSTTVRVRDNGCGIPAEKIDRIFNPFFTTKEKAPDSGWRSQENRRGARRIDQCRQRSRARHRIRRHLAAAAGIGTMDGEVLSAEL